MLFFKSVLGGHVNYQEVYGMQVICYCNLGLICMAGGTFLVFNYPQRKQIEIFPTNFLKKGL